jgi:DNA anti-recombination protein RmuC
MQQMAWTDERLEERFDRIDQRFDEVDRRFDEMSRRFGEVNRDLDGIHDEVRELRQAMLALHTTLARGSFGVILALIGAIGALVATGS